MDGEGEIAGVVWRPSGWVQGAVSVKWVCAVFMELAVVLLSSVVMVTSDNSAGAS